MNIKLPLGLTIGAVAMWLCRTLTELFVRLLEVLHMKILIACSEPLSKSCA